MKGFVGFSFVLALLIAAAVFTLPSEVTVRAGSSMALESALPVQVELGEGEAEGTLKLFGVLPLKSVDVEVLEPKMLIPGGFPVTIKLFTEGVLVVGLGEVDTEDGKESPGEQAGLALNDVIEAVDGQAVSSIEDITAIVQQNGSEALVIDFVGEGEDFESSFSPDIDVEGHYALGLWVRDSAAGVGTVSFIDPQSGAFGALGHGITDVDTGALMPLDDGSVQQTQITEVVKGKRGAPGQLHGSFEQGREDGSLYDNNESGIYGVFEPDMYESRQAMPIGGRAEVSVGQASILSCVQGQETREYGIEIIKINDSDAQSRNFLIEITDGALLEQTGGIVQGMSGSPIIQNGKLIGAVTHVLVDDPTRGYGIFIENMLESAESIGE